MIPSIMYIVIKGETETMGIGSPLVPVVFVLFVGRRDLLFHSKAHLVHQHHHPLCLHRPDDVGRKGSLQDFR